MGMLVTTHDVFIGLYMVNTHAWSTRTTTTGRRNTPSTTPTMDTATQDTNTATSTSRAVTALCASRCGTYIAAALLSSHDEDVVLVWQCETSGYTGLSYAQETLVVCAVCVIVGTLCAGCGMMGSV